MSSAACPHCGSPLATTEGIVTCEKCGATVMFDFDGNIQGTESAAAGISQEFSAVATNDPAPIDQAQAQSQSEFANEQEGRNQQNEFTNYEQNLDSDNSPSGELLGAHREPSKSELVPSFDEPLGFDQQEDLPVQGAAIETFEDVAAYGNQETPAGAIHYEVRVSEINSGDMRDEVIGRLAQPRFGFSARDIEALIQNGEIVLSKLNPAQAVLMVGALRDLDVVVRWKQGLYEV